MADRVEVFDVTVTAGTAKATPQLTTTQFADGYVTDVEVVIPDGCKGLVGFQLAKDGNPIIPNTAGAFITGNDEVIRWPIDNFPFGGKWQLRAYNTGVFDHTLEVRYLIREWQPPSAPAEVLPVAIPSSV